MNSFSCINCNKEVTLDAPGTKNRNHCPFCLYSKHVDGETPGDRAHLCNGPMKAIAKHLKSNDEESLVHKCEKCGFERRNRIAGDDDYLLVEELPLS